MTVQLKQRPEAPKHDYESHTGARYANIDTYEVLDVLRAAHKALRTGRGADAKHELEKAMSMIDSAWRCGAAW